MSAFSKADYGDRVPEGAKVTYWTELDGDYAEESATLAQADYIRREARGHIAVADRKIWKHVEFDVVVPVPDITKEASRPALVDNRDPECVKAWPGCHTFGYDPACCRFPKSCSAGTIALDTTNHESEG